MSNTSKRIVVLTGSGAEHIYLANVLTARFNVAAIVVASPPPTKPLKSHLKKGVFSFCSKLARKTYLKVIGDAHMRTHDMHAVLGEESQAFNPVCPIIYSDIVKSEALYNTIKDLNPDLLAVYGTSIVPDRVLHLANDLALNMHTGISPYYRGTACAFWPIHENEPHMVGATVHECTSAIDGGQIFAVAPADLTNFKSLHTIFSHAVQAGAQLYLDTVDKYLNGTLSGKIQDQQIGREYRGYMLTLRAELRARYNIWRLRQRSLDAKNRAK